jgi:hypothetical protein
MFLEHLIYSAAIALIVGMIFMYYTGRDPSWLVMLMTIVPDIDFIISRIMLVCNCSPPFILYHGDFHNIISLLFISLVVALILSRYGMNFGDVLCCSIIGYSAHLAEDFFVYSSWYSYFYPWSLRVYGIAIIPETGNLWGIAGSQVLAVGIILLGLAICIRIYFDDTGKWTVGNWIRGYMNAGRRVKYYIVLLLLGNSEELEE